MDKIPQAKRLSSEALLPTDLLASLLMEQASERSSATANRERLPLKVYGVMAVTALLTFGSLVTGYQMLFPHQLFA